MPSLSSLLRAITFSLVLMNVAPVWAAPDTGELQIEVKDPSGAPTGATGTLMGITKGSFQTFATDAQGIFKFHGLENGEYRIRVERRGFAPQVRTVRVPDAAASEVFVLALASQTTAIAVVAATPLMGTDEPLADVPGMVQSASAKDLQQAGALTVADFLNQKFSAIHINENQENPFQPDVNYRGYTASPLLGTPEGLSVYLDGVRQNQPLGDIVAWDLIPEAAISEVEFLPGSNPVFGLNTLGGTLAMKTKDGFSAPGTEIEASGGSFGRRMGSLEHGGSTASGFNYYVAGTWFKENGWRRFSPSEVRQGFGKVGKRTEKMLAELSFGYADNYMAGNGTQDGRWLAEDYRSVYTVTDATWNRSPFFNLSLSRELSPNWLLSGTIYERYIRLDTINPNLNGNSFDESLYKLSASDIAALTAAGYSGFPTRGNATTEPFPYWRCIAQGLSHNEPIEKCDAIVASDWEHTHNYGFSAQSSYTNGRNHFTLGLSLDRSGIRFQQSTQFGYLNPDRVTITTIPAFEDGSSNSNGVPVDTRVHLYGTVNTPSVYGVDTYTRGRWSVTMSARYNREHLQNFDRLAGTVTAAAGSEGGRGSLNGDYLFQRLNAAIGTTYNLGFANAYGSYSEASRAPTTLELGCADPNYPCNLPNALVSDPPLKQVVTRTFEFGLRSPGERRLKWAGTYFFGQNYNDLLFVSSDQTGFGYFQNFAKTRRTGVELHLQARFGKFDYGTNYTFQKATYRTTASIDGGSNSTQDSGEAGVDGNITIQPGNLIPQIPKNLGKAYITFQPTKKIYLALNLLAVGRSFARGNENNLDQPDGVYYLAPGFSPGYSVLNFNMNYKISRYLEVFAQANNLLNHRYYTAAQLGTTPFDNNYNFVARPFPILPDGNYPLRSTTFFAPGAPLGAWAGLRLRF